MEPHSSPVRIIHILSLVVMKGLQKYENMKDLQKYENMKCLQKYKKANMSPLSLLGISPSRHFSVQLPILHPVKNWGETIDKGIFFFIKVKRESWPFLKLKRSKNMFVTFYR